MRKSKIIEKLIDDKDKEIAYLRGLNKDLHNRLMALSDKASQFPLDKVPEVLKKAKRIYQLIEE